MSVGCRFTSVALNEANSEYLLLTSRSYFEILALAPSPSSKLLSYETHTRADCIHDITPPTFMTLPSLGNHNLQVWILV